MKFSITDKIIRLILAFIGLSVFLTQFFQEEIIEIIFGIFGMFFLITTLLDFCPFYYILGIKKTVRRKKDNFY
jgi:uncharacterized membrane protein YfcA